MFGWMMVIDLSRSSFFSSNLYPFYTTRLWLERRELAVGWNLSIKKRFWARNLSPSGFRINNDVAHWSIFIDPTRQLLKNSLKRCEWRFFNCLNFIALSTLNIPLMPSYSWLSKDYFVLLHNCLPACLRHPRSRAFFAQLFGTPEIAHSKY